MSDWLTYGPRPPETPSPIEWREMAAAPRDGSWVLLDVEDGSTDCDDYQRSSVYVGRWHPVNVPNLGTHFYEWELIDRYPDTQFNDGTLTNHYSEGRVLGWLPLPNAVENK